MPELLKNRLLGQEDIGGGDFQEPKMLLKPNRTSARNTTLPGGGMYEGAIRGAMKGVIPTRSVPQYYAAHNQSAMDTLGNAVVQFGSEFGLGFLESAGYLLDFSSWHKAWTDGESSLDNSFSNAMRQARENINERFQIYRGPNEKDFDPINPKWWARNFSSIATALSLMIPSTLIARGASALLKGTSLTRNVQMGLSGVAAGLGSRHMESLMEANSTMDQMLKSGYSPEEAGKAASDIYRKNAVLAAVDILQFTSLLRGGRGLQKTFSRSAQKRPLWQEIGIQSPSEAVEEFYQGIVGTEAELVATGQVDQGIFFGRDFGKRFHEYLKDGELWTAAWFGAIGGAAFPAVFQATDNFYNYITGHQDKLKSEEVRNQMAAFGDPSQSRASKDTDFFSMAYQFASQGRMHHMEEMLTTQIENEQDVEKKEEFEYYMKNMPKFEEIFNKVMNKPNYTRLDKFEHVSDAHTALKALEVSHRWERHKNLEGIKEQKGKFQKLLEDVTEEELPADLRNVLKEYYVLLGHSMGLFKGQPFNKSERKKRAQEFSKKIKPLVEKYNISRKLDPEGNTLAANTTMKNLLYDSLPDHAIDLLRAATVEHALELGLKQVNYDLSQLGTARGRNELLGQIEKGELKRMKRANKNASLLMGEGVKIKNEKTGKEYVIKNKEGDLFTLEDTAFEPEGVTTEDFTDEEFDEYLKTKKASKGRLATIASKLDKGEDLSRKEQKVAQDNKKEIDKIRSTKFETNKGKGFQLTELQDWMTKNGFAISDNVAYQEKLKVRVLSEELDRERRNWGRLSSALSVVDSEIARLQQKAIDQPQNPSVPYDIMNALSRRARILDNMAESRNRFTALEDPSVTAKQLTALDKEIFSFYTEAAERLRKQRAEAYKELEEFKELTTFQKAYIQELRQDLKSGKISPKKYYPRLKELQEGLGKLEENVEETRTFIQEISDDLERYEKRSFDYTGRQLVAEKKKVKEILEGKKGKDGLRDIISKLARGIKKNKEFLEEIENLLLNIFDVPKSKMNDVLYIKKVLDEAEKLGDEEINELVKKARQRNKVVTKLGEINKQIESLRKEAESHEAILSEIEQIEEAAGKPPSDKKEKERDVEINVDEKASFAVGDYGGVREPKDYFNYLGGLHFPGNGRLDITDSPYQRRFFKFVADNTTTKGNYFIKVVSPYIKVGDEVIPNEIYHGLDPEYVKKDKDGNIVSAWEPDDLIAIIVDKDGLPVDIEGKPMEVPDESLTEMINKFGIFTTVKKQFTPTYLNNYERKVTAQGREFDQKKFDEEVKKAEEDFFPKRKELLDYVHLGNHRIFRIESKSVGVPVIERNEKGEMVLKPALLTVKNKKNANIEIVKAKKGKRGQFQFEQRELGSDAGVVYLRDTISGQVNKVYPRKLSEEQGEVETVFQLFKLAHENPQGLKNGFDTQIFGKGDPTTIKDVLSEYLYYGKNGYVYEELSTRKRFTGLVNFKDHGSKKLSDWVGKDEDMLREWISNQFHQIRSSKVGKNAKKEKYIPVVWDGEEFSKSDKKYKTYTDYLLDVDKGVLQSPIPIWEEHNEMDSKDEAALKVQRKNSNLKFDISDGTNNDVPRRKTTYKRRGKKDKETISVQQSGEAADSVPGIVTGGASEIERMFYDVMAETPDAVVVVGGDDSKSSQKPDKKAKGLLDTLGDVGPGEEGPSDTGTKNSRKSLLDRMNPDKKDGYEGKKSVVKAVKGYRYENMEQARLWFEERFPDVPFRVVRDLTKTHGAWGMFTKHGEVLMSPLAAEGTIYHESFHVTTGLYLGSMGRKALYNQWRKANDRVFDFEKTYSYQRDIVNKFETDVETIVNGMRNVSIADDIDYDIDKELKVAEENNISYLKYTDTDSTTIEYFGKPITRYIFFNEKGRKQAEAILANKDRSGSEYEAVLGYLLQYNIKDISSFTGLSEKDIRKLIREVENDQIEEELAEDFRNYIITGKIPDYSYEKSFFQKLLDFIKWVLGLKSDTIQEVFKKISDGYYKNVRPSDSSNLIKDRARSRTFSGKSVRFTKEAIEGINYLFFNSANSGNMSGDNTSHTLVKEIVDGTLSKKDLNIIYDNVKTSLQEDIDSMTNSFYEVYEYLEKLKNLKSPTRADFEDMRMLEDFMNIYNDRIEAREYLLQNFNSQVIPAHQHQLAKLSLTLNIEESAEDEFTLSNDSKDNDWNIKNMEFSGKATVSNIVKMFLSTVPKIDKDQNHVTNSLGFKTFEDFGKMYAIVANETRNTRSIPELTEKLETLSLKLPTVNKIIRMFNLNKPLASLSGSEVDKQTMLLQAFGKFWNDYSKWIINSNGNHIREDAAKETSLNHIRNQWENNFKFEVDPDFDKAYKNDEPISYEMALDQAEAMGMSFEDPDSLSLDERSRFIDDIKYVSAEVYANREIYKDKEVWTTKPSGEKELTIVEPRVKGRILSLLKAAYSQSTDHVENSKILLGNKTMYNLSYFSYYSRTIDKLNVIARSVQDGTFSESEAQNAIYEEFPEMMEDWYSINGKVLENITQGIEIGHSIEQGIDSAYTQGIEFEKLEFRDRFFVQLNNALAGKYHLIRPSDNKQERILDFGLFMGIDEVDIKQNGVMAPVELLMEYLQTELEVLKMANMDDVELYREWNTLSSTLNVDFHHKDLDDAIKDKQITEALANLQGSGMITSMISSDEGLELIRNYILGIVDVETVLGDPVIINHLTNWFNTTVDNTINTFLPDLNISKYIANPDYKDFSKKSIIKTFVINYAIAQIEQTKLFTGHPGLFGNPENLLKRFTGPVGMKPTLRTDASFNDYLLDVMKIDKVRERGNSRKAQVGKVRTSVVADMNVMSPLLEQYEEIFNERYSSNVSKEKASKYKNQNEADAQGWIDLDEYRIFKLRAGDWSWQQEISYQWETQGASEQVTIPKDNPYVEIAGKTFTRKDVEKDGAFLVPIKPQHYGPLADEMLYINSFYKLHLTPMLPSLMKGRNLKKVGELMKKKGIGILTFESGNKTGTKTFVTKEGDYAVQPIYTESGEIVDDLNYQTTYYENWGIQVYNSPKVKATSSNGSQNVKIIQEEMIVNGIPMDFKPDESNRVSEWNALNSTQKEAQSKAYKLIKELRRLTNARQKIGFAKLLDRFGIKKETVDGIDEYSISDRGYDKLKETLIQEFMSREVADNILDSIVYLDRGIDFLVNREKVENLLMSIADKMTISQKRFGKSSVQVASTFLEPFGARATEDGVIVSNQLKFYQDKDGKITEMEVYVPHYFKELYGKDVNFDKMDLDPRLLGIVGFRIPTQALGSIENIRIKGFLPPMLGDIVVVPTELVTKTGADFDWDKLFMHFPHYEMVNGVPEYVEFTRNKNILWGKRKDNYLKNTPKFAQELDGIFFQLADSLNLLSGKDLEKYGNDLLSELMNWKKERESLVENGILPEIYFPSDKKYFENVESITDPEEMVKFLSEKKAKAISDLETEAFAEFAALDEVEQNGKAAVENRLLEIYKELLSMRQRFAKFVNPLDASNIKKLSDEVITLRNGAAPNNTPSPLSDLMDPVWSISKGLSFQQGKQNVGVEALSITSHTLFSQVGITVNLNKGENIKLRISEDPEGRPSMYGTTDVEKGNYIADILSEMANGYLDVQKDPFMFRINAGPDGVGVYNLLIRMGTPIRDVVMFMNQPAISEYLKLKSESNSLYTIKAGDSLQPESIKRKVVRMFKTESMYNVTKNAYRPGEMSNNIRKYAEDKLSEPDKAVQIDMLNQFLMLDRIANDLSAAIRSITYDTASVGKNTYEIMKKVHATRQVQLGNRFRNFDKLFERGEFLTSFKETTELILEAYSPLMPHLNNYKMREVFNNMVHYTAGLFDPQGSIGTKIKNNLVDFILLNYIKFKPHLIYSTIDGDVNSRSVPRKVIRYQRAIERGDTQSNQLIEDLSVHLDNRDVSTDQVLDNLSLREGAIIDPTETSLYAEAWSQLDPKYLSPRELLEFILLQSGLQNSPINFINMVPAEIYNELIDEMIQTSDLEASNFKRFQHEFMFNNRTNDLWRVTRSIEEARNGNAKAYKYVFEIPNDPFGREGESYYYEGQLVDRKKMKSVRNFSKNSTLKYYRDYSIGHYLTGEGRIRTGTQESGMVTQKVSKVKLGEKQLNPDPNIVRSLKKIISGGQTGADRIGLEVARLFGIETGGLAPKGYKTENDFKDAKLLIAYGLSETESSNYTPRTIQNIKDSDGTVVFAVNITRGGSANTIQFAKEQGKPLLVNPTADELRDWIISNKIKVLNVAGNRATSLSDSKIKEIRSTLIMALNERKC